MNIVSIVIAFLYVVKIIFGYNSILETDFIYHYLSQVVELIVPILFLLLLGFYPNKKAGRKNQPLIYLYAILILLDTIFNQSLNGLLAIDVVIYYLVINGCNKEVTRKCAYLIATVLIAAEAVSLLL